VPTLFRGDHAEVFALRLGTFAHAAGHGGLGLARRANAAVAFLDADRHRGRVLHPLPTPRAAHTALHRAHGLALGVAAFESGLDQRCPEVRQWIDAGPEQIDALAAGDLAVQVEPARNLADDDQLVRCNLAAGNARNDRVRPTALDIGEEPIIGVL